MDIGLKIGLEVHQQIEGKKLFCNCPTIIKDDAPDFKIKRFLRASASELGEIDKAALYELKKGKYFIYNGYNECNCLVEIDEEPPKGVNKDALETCLQVALLLNCKIVDEIQFMRKVVIDGSAVSGFQRTALIGADGYIITSEGKISIPTICLEEEAAKKVEDNKEKTVYNISRLGIPLIEISTSPDIKSPSGAKEAAEKIGMILRSVEGIKRGLGTIRQDLNISIKNGARTEIKGFQDLQKIPKVLEYEIKRQMQLIEKNEKVEESVRKAEDDFTTSYLRPMPGAERMYPETDVEGIKIDKKELMKIKLPELIDEKIERIIERYGIERDKAKELIRRKISLEDYKKYNDFKFVANILIDIPKEIKRRFNLDVQLKDLEKVLEFIFAGKINKDAVIEILVDKIKSKKFNLEKFKKVKVDSLEGEIKKIIEENKNASFNALMGEVMNKFKGKISGKEAAEMLKKLKP